MFHFATSCILHDGVVVDELLAEDRNNCIHLDQIMQMRSVLEFRR